MAVKRKSKIKRPVLKAARKPASGKAVERRASAKAQVQPRRGDATAQAAQGPSSATGAGGQASVLIRMYCLGVGDCFLVRLRKKDGSWFKILIDCGVHMSQTGGPDRIRKAVADLLAETGGSIDVIVGTHEHYDHLSGFLLAKDDFQKIKAGEIWCAWTEDETDPFSQQLRRKRTDAIKALALASAHAEVSGAKAVIGPLSGLLGFFGDGTGQKLSAAAQIMKTLSDVVRYRKPGEAPFEIPGVDARIFVLGPPRDVALIRKDKPSTGPQTEVYPFGAYQGATDALQFAFGSMTPFDAHFGVPLESAQADPFFLRNYWITQRGDENAEREDATQDWRRIDTDWLAAATSLALDLDDDTNNTSLVLALELGTPGQGGPVLLFAADAQVGNWLSWQNVSWDYCGRTVTGPDLLRRTLVYKVGHHASHNATLRKLGLEMMNALELALVPTDAEMAKKVGWGTLPWPNLLTALNAKTGNRVVRSDLPAPPAALGRFTLKTDAPSKPLYYEVGFSP